MDSQTLRSSLPGRIQGPDGPVSKRLRCEVVFRVQWSFALSLRGAATDQYDGVGNRVAHQRDSFSQQKDLHFMARLGQRIAM